MSRIGDAIRDAWACRRFGVGAADDYEDGDDRPDGSGLRRFYGPEARRRAAIDIRRGTGPRCDGCGRRGSSSRELFIGPHPYHSEINGDETDVSLCGDCHHEACMDI